MPISIFREVYVSFQQLRRRLIAFNTYRRLTHNMEKRFESIKDEEELDRLGHTCIICRDQLDLSGGCKKLPCGHAFHTHCLREWLVQQQTCPTCRSDIAAGEARRKKELERERAAAAAAAAAVQRGEGGDATDTAEVNGVVEDGAVSAGANAEQSQTDTSTADTSTTQPGVSQKESQQALDQSGAASNTAIATSPQPKQSDESKSTPDDLLPAGWTAHVDDRSGRIYYFNKVLGKSSWDNPGVPVAGQHEVANALGRALAANRSSAQFPCLYRVTFPAGAPVFPSTHSPSPHTNGMMASTQPPPRIIPCGKLVVCLAIEYWPMPFQEAMLCTPDGYVRSRDVERFMMLGSREELGTTKAASALGLAH